MKKLLIAAMALLSFTSASLALDLSQKFKDGDGALVPNTLTSVPAKGSTCGEAKDVKCLTLGDALFHALVSNYADEQGSITGEEKFRRGSLAMKVSGQLGSRSPGINLTADETVLVKKLIGKLFSPLIVAQSYGMLEPQTILVPVGPGGAGGGGGR